MLPSPYDGPRFPPANDGSIWNVHTAFPVTASSAYSFEPELKYVTPSTTSGVSSRIDSDFGTSYDHFSTSLPAFAAVI